MLKGIDISSWQGDPDYTKLVGRIDFIIIKSSEGSSYTDPKFARNQSEARAKGIPLGYYHFCRPDLGNTAEAEADWFLKVIGTPKTGELFFLDFEVGYADAVNWCKKWLDRVKSKIGCKPLIYLNQSHLKNFNWKPIIDADYGLWLAVYDYNPLSEPPATAWSVMAFRQYTNKLTVTGISGVVDGNVFYGDKEILKAYGLQAPLDYETLYKELQVKFDKYISAVDIQVKAYQGDIASRDNKIKALLSDQAILKERIKQLELKLSGQPSNIPSKQTLEVLIEFLKGLIKGGGLA